MHHFQAVFRSLEDFTGQAQVAELQQKLGVAHLEALRAINGILRGVHPAGLAIPTWVAKIIINPDSIIQSIINSPTKPHFFDGVFIC